MSLRGGAPILGSTDCTTARIVRAPGPGSWLLALAPGPGSSQNRPGPRPCSRLARDRDPADGALEERGNLLPVDHTSNQRVASIGPYAVRQMTGGGGGSHMTLLPGMASVDGLDAALTGHDRRVVFSQEKAALNHSPWARELGFRSNIGQSDSVGQGYLFLIAGPVIYAEWAYGQERKAHSHDP